jgi:hypothetical protein
LTALYDKAIAQIGTARFDGVSPAHGRPNARSVWMNSCTRSRKRGLEVRLTAASAPRGV